MPENSLKLYTDHKIDPKNTDNFVVSQPLPTHDQILSAICSASAHLLRSANIEENILEALTSFADAIGITSCVLFNINLSAGKPALSIIFTWQKPGSICPELKTALEPYLPRIEQMQDSLIFVSSDQKVPALLEKQPFSLAILPINRANASREYLGLIDSDKRQVWTDSQRETLHTATNLIGAIIERIRYEGKFRENEALNRAIIDALPDLVIRINATGKILDYTSRKDHPLFISRDTITGKMLSDVWPKSIVKKIVPSRKKGLFPRTHLLEEFKLPFNNKVYESRLDPIGSGQEALIVIRDVTDQAELKQMKSDFINHASHELRTPVTAAILMADLIQGGGPPEEIEEYWQILNNELNRQKILIDRLLIAGRLESGMMHLEIAPTDLTAILQDSISAIKPIARKKNISIELSTPANMPKILGDKSGLQQVFINLINNATKFSPPGSTIQVNVVQKGANMQVAIVDQGMGIPASETPHLFERFFRARDVTIAEIPGSGVGLYIVKSILEGLGGSIKLTSSSPAGTTFTATLRCAE